MVGKETDIVWVNQFDEPSFKEFYDKFTKLEKDPSISVIPVVIDSYGGQVYTMLAMRDMIKSSPKQVATIIIGKAMSCGAYLAAAGTPGLRFSAPNASIMLHQVSGAAIGKTEDIVNDAKVYASLNSNVAKRLSEDIGMTHENTIKLIKGGDNVDQYISPQKALTIGLIDQIAVPRVLVQAPQEVLVTISNKGNKNERKATRTKK